MDSFAIEGGTAEVYAYAYATEEEAEAAYARAVAASPKGLMNVSFYRGRLNGRPIVGIFDEDGLANDLVDWGKGETIPLPFDLVIEFLLHRIGVTRGPVDELDLRVV